MVDDPLIGFSEVDSTIRRAVAAMDRGDVPALEELLARHPRLVRDRVDCGAGYFANPYLLWFVAGNPVRNERLPGNAAEVAEAIIEFAAKSGVDSLQEQIDYTLSLVCSGAGPRESGVQLELVDVLVGAGADPDGALDPALAHREEEAVRHLLDRGARLTPTAAAALGRIQALAELLGESTPAERQVAFAAAAIWGRADAIRSIASRGVAVNEYNPSGFQAHGTALHSAVAARSPGAVEALLEIGASPAIRDRMWDGTPLEWAAHLEEEEIASLLREAVVRRLYDSSFAPEVVRELVAEELEYHLPSGQIGGRAELLAGGEAFRSAFPDVEFSILELRVDGDEVEVSWEVRGTHEGDFAGFAPTGREVVMTGRHVERVVGGRVVERWGESDHHSLVRQLSEE